MNYLKGILPMLVLSAWVSCIGWMIWVKAHQSMYPPLEDPASYIMKAEKSWENASQGFPRNPLNVEMSMRPPGTVLISFPFGYNGDYKAFHFRTVFIPFLIWCWPIGVSATISDKWLAVWISMLFGSQPFLLQFEPSPDSMNIWGMMDQALGATAGFAMAAVARSRQTRSILLLTLGIMFACLSVLIKPAGVVALIFTAAFFFVGEVLVIRNRMREAKSLNWAYQAMGLLLFVILGGGVILLCLKSEYTITDNINFFRGALRYLLILEREADKWEMTGRLYTYLGIQGVILLAWTAMLPMRNWIRGKGLAEGLDILMSMLILIFGYWMLATRIGLSQTRYFSPFAFMSYSLVIGSVIRGYRNGAISHKALKILKIPSFAVGTAIALSTLACLATNSPSHALQRILGISVGIREVENDGIRIAHWLNKSYGERPAQTAVFPMLDSDTLNDGSYGAIKGIGWKFWESANHLKKGPRIVQPLSWSGDPAFDLRDLVCNSDLILLVNDTTLRVRKTPEISGYMNDYSEIRRFLNKQADQGRVETTHREGWIRVIRIPDKDRFLELFDSTFAHQAWSPAFIQKNRIVRGRVHLFDTVSHTAPFPFGGTSDVQAITHLDDVNGLPADADTLASGRFLKLSGWLAADASKGLTADTILITLEDGEGRIQVGRTTRTGRPDLLNNAGQSSLFLTGFNAELDLRRIHGTYTLDFTFVKEGKWYRIPGGSRKLMVKNR
ncbi:MAG: hypothetical protein EBZ67_02285 [Chitinophagia bacterium]|nr:hypothetical protein [Chitinophagia bacterium]